MRNGVGFANSLTDDHKFITYEGKLVVLSLNGLNSKAPWPSDEIVDDWIADNLKWGDVKQYINSLDEQTIQYIRFDDGKSVSIDDCIVYTEIPDDADMYFVLEPAFYLE